MSTYDPEQVMGMGGELLDGGERARARWATALAAAMAAACAICAICAICALCACGRADSATLETQCRDAAAAKLGAAADLCLASYGLTHDAATGARAARAMQGRPGARPIIDWIANAIGDSPAGADAWLAAGVSRSLDGDAPGALAAYERAVAMRGLDDTLGQLHDAVGLIYHHNNRGEYQAGMYQAVIAAALVDLVEPEDDRAVAYFNIANLLSEIGDLSTVTSGVFDRAKSLIPATSRRYAHLRRLEARFERASGHHKLADQALLEARALAIRDGDRDLESNVRMNLIDAALTGDRLDEAEMWLAVAPIGRDALPNARAVDAYQRGRLAIARGTPAVAIRIVEQALRDPPQVWIAFLEDVHGRALWRAGDLAGAERALARAAEENERKRDDLGSDTVKSWLLAEQRGPFEDLFLLHESTGRLDEALAVAQRATARSTLDRLLGGARSAAARPATLAAVDEWHRVQRGLMRVLASGARPTPAMPQVRAQLRGHHVITYFSARGELWAIASGADGQLTAHDIGKAARISALVAAMRRDPEQPAAAEALGMALLPDPMMPARDAAFYVVSDEPIAEVAFAALRRRGELVLDHHAVGYAPSAAVLSVMRRPDSPIRPLVIGDPTGDLPDARKEAIEVAARFGVTPLLGAKATTEALLKAPDATLIHIAAHTEETPLGNAIVMSDGLLDAGTLLDNRVATGAIVLLTCSSAPISNRDELAAIAAAFVASGAHTVVASRWAIDDKVARAFAHYFYDNNGVADPVRAVAAAQRLLMTTKIDGAAVPVEQWSSFAVIGGLF